MANEINLKQWNPDYSGNRGRNPKNVADQRHLTISIAVNEAEFNLYVRAKNARIGRADGRGRVGSINRNALLAVWEQVINDTGDTSFPKPKIDRSRYAESTQAQSMGSISVSEQREWLDSLEPVSDVSALLNDVLSDVDL